MSPGTHTSWILLCSASFTRDWSQSLTDLECIWKLSRALDGCLTVGKNIDVPTCVVLFYILHYTSLSGVYFSLEYRGVEPKTEAVPPSRAPSIHPLAIAFLGPRPVCVLDQARFFEPILSFTLVRELEWMRHWTSWPLKMGQMHCPETSVKVYHLTLHNTTKECRSQTVLMSTHFSP
jgi:hypothetical protein